MKGSPDSISNGYILDYKTTNGYIGDMFAKVNPGDVVYCKPSKLGLPQVANFSDHVLGLREEGIYTVYRTYYPDPKRFPMVTFVYCSDSRGTTIFSILEVRAIHV